jgi:hypothetical protein
MVDSPLIQVDGGDRNLIGPHSYKYCKAYESGLAKEPTYGFNASIIRVNKKTYENVQGRVIENKKFVLVKYSIPEFRNMLHCCNVPIVADQHTMSIDLEWSTGPFCNFARDQRNRPLNNDPWRDSSGLERPTKIVPNAKIHVPIR